MSLLPLPDPYPYAWYLRPLLFLLRRNGTLSEAVRLWARTPAAFIGFLWLWRSLERRRSPLEPRLRALIRTRVSQLETCAFCIDLNGKKALELGVPEEKLLVLGEYAGSALYQPAEKAALAYAEAITRSGQRVDPAMIQALQQHFSDTAIVELAALIAHQNMSAKFNTALGAQP